MNDVDPEKVVGGGGVLVALLAFFKWLFTSKVAEVDQKVDKVHAGLAELNKTLTDMNNRLLVLTSTSIPREDFDNVRIQLAKLNERVDHLEKLIEQMGA